MQVKLQGIFMNGFSVKIKDNDEVYLNSDLMLLYVFFLWFVIIIICRPSVLIIDSLQLQLPSEASILHCNSFFCNQASQPL
jgi:predicted transporter